MPKVTKAGPSNQKIPASGTVASTIAFARVGIQMILKSTYTQVVIFVAFFLKFRSPIQIAAANFQ